MFPAWRPWLLIAAAGAAVILAGIILQIIQLGRQHPAARGVAGRDWRPVGWALPGMGDTFAPARLQLCSAPYVEGEDAYWSIKQRARERERLSDERPMRKSKCRGTARPGFVCAFFATFMGFALIWDIWWLVALGVVGAFATFVAFAWRGHR